MNNKKLQGKIALVTGGRRGIGQAVSLALSAAGADVAVCDMVTDDGLLDNVVANIRESGHGSIGIRMDISSKPDVENAINSVLDKFGRIDILVNCAGVWIPGPVLVECSEKDWDKVIDTNLKGTLFCCQAAGKVMMKQRSGNIINLSSQAGLNPGYGVGAYSISKAGIIMLTRQMAIELASYNIRVNAIAPGVVKTDFNIDLWKDPEMEKSEASGVPLSRLAEPEDIARTAVFLASEDSSYITGDIIKVDGGWSIPPVRPGSHQV